MMLKNIKKYIKSKVNNYFSKSSEHYFGSEEWKSKFGRYGSKSLISAPAIIGGEKGIYIGERTTILNNSRLQNFYLGDVSPEIVIGNDCYICYYFTVLNASRVTIGNDVLIASHVLISSENHGIDPESEIPYMHQSLISKPVMIGNGCWIGEKVIILPGVTIGNKCIIGAGSVVTHSIPDYSIAVGNPARVVKKYNFETHIWEKI